MELESHFLVAETKPTSSRKRAGEPLSSGRLKKFLLGRHEETDFTKSPEEHPKVYKVMVQSLKADIAEESRPLTEWMSMWERFIVYGEELVVIYTHATERTRLESEIALNAARIRFLEASSLEMLETLFWDEEGDMIARAMIHKKRTDNVGS